MINQNNYVDILWEKFKDLGIKKDVVQVIAGEMQEKGRSLKEAGEILYIVFHHGQKKENIEKMMQDGVPINLIQQVLPYLDQSNYETFEIRKEHIGEQAEYLNCFVKRVYPVIEERIEELRNKITSTDKWLFAQMYRLLEGNLDLMIVYGDVYDKSGAVSKNIRVYKKDIENIMKLFMQKFEAKENVS